jgi:hypothetical protein
VQCLPFFLDLELSSTFLNSALLAFSFSPHNYAFILAFLNRAHF